MRRFLGYDVLVASDAVGMGLNLNIRRVILDSVKKFNGVALVDIEPSLVRVYSSVLHNSVTLSMRRLSK